MMTADDVLYVLGVLEQDGVEAWVDGGWGVDALLGEQTRDHNDLDLAVPSQDEARFREVVGRRGFVEVSAEPHNPVLHDNEGRIIDIHFVDMTVVRPGPRGWLVYGDISYDVGAFEGHGIIGDTPVACSTVQSQMRSHTGYQLDEQDVHDVLALHRRFGVALPDGLPGASAV